MEKQENYGFWAMIQAIVFYVLSFPSGVNYKVVKPTSVRAGGYLKIGISVWNNATLSAVGMGLMCSQSGVEFWSSFGISFVWFWFVVNLDRFLLSFSNTGKGKSKLAISISRLAITLLLAAVIGEQLVQWAFRSDIDAQIVRTQISKREETLTSLRASDIEVNQLESDKTRQQNLLVDLLQKVEKAREEYISEAEGTAGSGLVGKGPLFQEKLNNYNAALQEKKDADEALKQIDVRLKSRYEKLEEALTAADNMQKKDRGFLARHHALMELVKNDWTMGVLYIFITLLLILFEVIPLVIKFNSDEQDYQNFIKYLAQVEDTERRGQIDANFDEIKRKTSFQKDLDNEHDKYRRNNLKEAIKAIRKNSYDNLSPEVMALVNELKRQQPNAFDTSQTAQAGQNQTSPPNAPITKLPVTVKNDNDTENFMVLFNQPADSIFGKDAMAILTKIELSRPKSLTNPQRPPLTDYQAQNMDGVAIVLQELLFDQLGQDQTLHLIPVLSPPTVSNATN
ncbi:MAG: DUF4407 domain-containing protein [Pyrinomonadaceae bacterium]